MKMLIEDKIKEYVSFGGDHDYRGCIPIGCNLSVEDFQLIDDLISNAYMYKMKMFSTEMNLAFEMKLKSLCSELNISDLLKLLSSLS